MCTRLMQVPITGNSSVTIKTGMTVGSPRELPSSERVNSGQRVNMENKQPPPQAWTGLLQKGGSWTHRVQGPIPNSFYLTNSDLEGQWMWWPPHGVAQTTPRWPRVLTPYGSPLSPPQKSPSTKGSCLTQGHTSRKQSTPEDRSVLDMKWKVFSSFRAPSGVS